MPSSLSQSAVLQQCPISRHDQKSTRPGPSGLTIDGDHAARADKWQLRKALKDALKEAKRYKAATENANTLAAEYKAEMEHYKVFQLF